MKSLLIFAASLLAMSAIAQQQVTISAAFYKVSAPIDTQSVKAIGSAQTKATPTILQVSKEEADRLAGLVTKSGGTRLGTPNMRTLMDSPAKLKIDTHGEGDSWEIDVTPSGKSSDTITLNFRMTLVSVIGGRRITRGATGMARLQEGKALLVIVNPRGAETGFLAVLQAKRQ